MNDNKFEMVAKTFSGLEDVLRDELLALGAENVETGNRMVSFYGELELMYRANFCLRSALRILKPIVKFTAADTDELYDIVRDIDWSQYLSPDSTFAIDSTVNSSEFTHSKFVTYRVKDGIVDHFNDRFGRRPSIRLTGADLILNVHIAENRVTISLDSSGEPLNQRGYRVESTEAPINEVLAAGIILKTGWRGDCPFVDPMCGSGTFLIEAALIAGNIYPGIFRKEFAFERWTDFDAELFATITADDTAEREIDIKICGGDISHEAVGIARKNIRAAGLDQYIDLVCMPFEEWTTPPPDGILVTNPPYGERLRPESIEDLYRAIGKELKLHFAGYHAWIIGYKGEHMDCIGLKPSVRYPLYNGALECTLREYVLFDGRYDDFKASGGTVHNSEFNRETRPKVRHLSDEEWDAETTVRRSDRKRDRRDFRRDDRKRDFKRDFKRDDRKRDDRRRDFRDRDDRRDFRRDDDRRDFRRRDDDRRDFRDRDDRRDFRRRDDDRRRDFRDRDDRREHRSSPAKELKFKRPSISEEASVNVDMLDGRRMRTRRTWQKRNKDENENENNND